MYQEVLKFGALIVDALCQYRQPVVVYIPPNGELRGGAWVVLDSTINPDMMEMYADRESRLVLSRESHVVCVIVFPCLVRGGVLEPEGIVEVKYKMRDLIKTMDRLDPMCKRLSTALGNAGRAVVCVTVCPCGWWF